MAVCWVHGVSSTGQVFNYLMDHVPPHESYRFEYDHQTSIKTNLKSLVTFLADHKCTKIVGHSMGGVMAAIMMRRGYVEKGTAIASPLSGLWLGNFFPLIRPLSDLRTMSPLIYELKKHRFDDNFLTVIATGLKGNQFTDGVVPVWSQKALKGAKSFTIPTNHYEVMLSPAVAGAISDHMLK